MVSTLAEAAAVQVLRDEDGWVERTVAECVENRARLAEALESRGQRPLPSAANFLMVPVGEGCAVRYANGLRQRGVAVRPFVAMPDVGDGLRVTVGPWPLMERFLEAFDEQREVDRADEVEVVVRRED
jgi:histidinol-phosphate/aromatic aminotransferase/cobyric acid decarboxylase-like protein